MASEPQRKSLPFEPGKKRNKPAETPTLQEPAKSKATQNGKPQKAVRASGAIPEAVSRRMVRRIAFFSGIPTTLGVSTFFVSYFIVTHHWFNPPHVAVVLVSMGFFGLGVLGLSYGALSACWDEDRVGSKLGLEEFTTNWARMTEAWAATKQKDS